MIDQQINLYQERFHDKRLWFSAAQSAAALLGLLAVIGIASFLLQGQLNQAERRNQQVKAERDLVTAELTTANLELRQLLEDTRLDQEIESTARQISARKKVLAFVDANRFGSGQGFSDYLVALSKLHVDDIWLSRIRFGENFIQIKGSSLDAGQVPGYFGSFSGETVFQGNRFDLFELKRDPDSDWKVDFEIATRAVSGE